jgi:hypothetical protein
MSNDGKQIDHTYGLASPDDAGLGPGSAGQSGDTQGLSDIAESDSESVLELVQEGQFLEAEAISGIEDSFDDEVSEIHTRQVPEEDVPEEYLENENLENDSEPDTDSE